MNSSRVSRGRTLRGRSRWLRTQLCRLRPDARRSLQSFVMRAHRWAAGSIVVVLSFVLYVVLSVATGEAGPDRYGFSDRVERHMLPFVSTGPLDPVFSPDG